MELDCPSCRARIQVNVHQVESELMMASFAAFVAFGALFYVVKQEGFRRRPRGPVGRVEGLPTPR